MATQRYLLEVRQQSVPVPSRICILVPSHFTPRIVICLAPTIKHLRIDRRAASYNLPDGDCEAAIVQAGLGLRQDLERIVTVWHRCGRHENVRAVHELAILDHKNGAIWKFGGKAVGYRQSGSASACDDVIIGC